MKTFAITFALLSMLTSTLSAPARQSSAPGSGQQENRAAWPDLQLGIEKMHTGMQSIRPSGDNDVDFVKLMMPHHQAAIDMAKTELLYGKDPQMRRLAQEIITDQQSETELMHLWLKRQSPDLKQ
jgi:uncharacterized protein (DUF305 family)